MKHEHHKENVHSSHTQKSSQRELFLLALSATFHCLVGCGIGEISGMIVSAALGLSNTNSIILSIILGFVAGLLLGILPLKKAGFGLSTAFKTVIVAEGLSIVVMEAFEMFIQVAIPGVMNAQLTDGIFWIGMTAALIAGFIAALPVNYVMIKQGIRHQHR